MKHERSVLSRRLNCEPGDIADGGMDACLLEAASRADTDAGRAHVPTVGNVEGFAGAERGVEVAVALPLDTWEGASGGTVPLMT